MADETDIKIKGQCKYLYRAVDSYYSGFKKIEII
ncbi:DDE-type integrase/transposase/recombinase [Candidatus Hamiltonella defensa]|nr:DDE-type integrase/transposase/recombinase [Candidatus Hamiltonella defensa]